MARWSTSRVIPAPGFIEPCLPTRVMQAPTGERWVHEIKHDGFRLIAKRVGADVRLYSRTGFDFTRRYALVTEALRRLRVRSIVLDGEVVCGTFDELWSGHHDHAAELCAFDLLELNGEDYRERPLLERKARLAKLLSRDIEGIQFVEHLAGDGPSIFEHVCKLGLEGLVSKRIDLPYQPGPSKSWQKTKNRAHPAIQRIKEAFEREREAQLTRRKSRT